MVGSVTSDGAQVPIEMELVNRETYYRLYDDHR